MTAIGTSRQALLRHSVLTFLFAALLAFSALPALGEGLAPHLDGAGFEQVVDPAMAWFAEQGLDAPRGAANRFGEFDLGTPFTLVHQVPLSSGAFLHVEETFSLRSWLRRPARAVLFLSGSAFYGDHWNIPVEGYDGADMAARKGYFAFTVDYIGVGQSFLPAQGRDASYEVNRAAMAELVRYIRYIRTVRRVDLVGEGYGGSIAMELGADRRRVRSVVTSAMLYREVLGGPLTDPAFIGFLESIPDGYFFAPGVGSLIFMADAPQAAQDWVVATQEGFFPVDNFLVATDRPFFDPSVSRVPGLVIHGPNDFIAPEADIRGLAEDYGRRGATFATHPDAGHAPRIEGPEVAAWFWQTIFDFLESPRSSGHR